MRTENFYRRIGPVYNFIFGNLVFDEGRRIAVEMMELNSGDQVLEVGVGTGLTFPFYPNDVDITGIDLSKSMLKEARDLIEKYGLKNACVREMNANAMNFADGSFDAVLGNLFISATDDPLSSLLEMKRVCKPGGKIVLMNHFQSENPAIAAAEELLSPLTQTIGFNSALDMRSLLKTAGLQPKRTEKVNLMGLWTAVSMTVPKTPRH